MTGLGCVVVSRLLFQMIANGVGFAAVPLGMSMDDACAIRGSGISHDYSGRKGEAQAFLQSRGQNDQARLNIIFDVPGADPHFGVTF